MVQHESGQMMLVKAARNVRVIMDQPQEIQAYVADHFGDTHTLSVPRKTFLELEGYPLGYRVCEDVHFLIRLVARSKRIGVICKPLGVYQIHGSSATRRSPVSAQQENVRTLLDLNQLTKTMYLPIRLGVRQRLHVARYNLACAFVKMLSVAKRSMRFCHQFLKTLGGRV